MSMRMRFLIVLGMAAAAACSGPAATPKAPEDGAGAKVEDAGPVIASHHVADRTVGASPPGPTGSVACDEYLATFDALVAKCKSEIGPALDAMKLSRDAQAEAFGMWGTMDAASKQAAVEAAAPACQSATDALRQAAISLGCAL